ncbi:flagellar basal body protein FliL [Terrihabitans soli]|uniref:Flagellar protein FliL n=1 Tax=Terrihabitans soli TaxID=708113 RepID=A0A6S6QWJ5_9HYPH|nr:flagellar basal body-associated FliL family protein [Terrihabitans soli]BCJ91612.1 flagellar basal body protein FliL [Terrihabitans soli]
MANVADAPDVDGGEGQEAPKGKSRFGLKLGKKQMIMAAGGLLVLLGLGGGAYFFLGGTHEEEAGHAEKQPVVFIDLPDMMVNLTAPSERPKYLKMKIALEVSDEKNAEQIRPLLPRVVDSFQTHLREMRPEDLDGSAGMYRLKEELLRRINQAVFPAKVDAILFKELLLQ